MRGRMTGVGWFPWRFPGIAWGRRRFGCVFPRLCCASAGQCRHAMGRHWRKKRHARRFPGSGDVEKVPALPRCRPALLREAPVLAFFSPASALPAAGRGSARASAGTFRAIACAFFVVRAGESRVLAHRGAGIGAWKRCQGTMSRRVRKAVRRPRHVPWIDCPENTGRSTLPPLLAGQQRHRLMVQPLATTAVAVDSEAVMRVWATNHRCEHGLE
jgi:hypothetical protein